MEELWGAIILGLLGGGAIGAVLTYRATRQRDIPTIDLARDRQQSEREIALSTGWAEYAERIEARWDAAEEAMRAMRDDMEKCRVQLAEKVAMVDDLQYEIKKLKRRMNGYDREKFGEQG